MTAEMNSGNQRRELRVIGLNLRSNEAGLDADALGALLDHELPTVAAFQEAYVPARFAISRVIESIGYQPIFPEKSEMDLAFAVSPGLRVVGTDELPFPREVRSIHTTGPWAREVGLFSIQVVGDAVETNSEQSESDRVTGAHDPTAFMLSARKALAAWRLRWMRRLTAGGGLHAFAADHNSGSPQQVKDYDQAQAGWGAKRLLPLGQITYLRNNHSEQPRKYGLEPEVKGWSLDGVHAWVPDGHELIPLADEKAVNSAGLRMNQVGFHTDVVDAKPSDHGAVVVYFSLPKTWTTPPEAGE